jgi:uncharacterized membrane protein
MSRIHMEDAMLKSVSFGFLHLGIAFAVAYALTGSIAIAGAITFVEPVANTVAHYFFDRWWDRPGPRAWRQRHGLERQRSGATEDRRPTQAHAGPDVAGEPGPHTAVQA